MREKENPVDVGASAKTVIPNITESTAPVKSQTLEILIFFHNVLSDLPADDYKLLMSAICSYAQTGLTPDLSGYQQVVFRLAIAHTENTPTQIRKRGGQIGNRNAAKKTEKAIETKAENESETNRVESFNASVPVPVPASATVPVEASTPLINLNLIAGNESKEETAKRKCGDSQPLQGLACPKCAGTYQWDEQAQKMEWYIHYEFPFSAEFGKIIESKRFKARGEANAQTV